MNKIMQKYKTRVPFRLLLALAILKKVVLVLIILLSAEHARAQDPDPQWKKDLPELAKPIAWVSDHAGVLSASEEQALNAKLNQFEYRTSTQIFVVTIRDSKGYPADMLAPELGHEWGVGQSDDENGILILADIGQRDIFIATGYGSEEFVTDLAAGRIVDHELLPNFRNGDYYTGFDQASTVLISLLDGKFTADEYQQQTSSPAGGFPILGFIIMMIIFSALFRGRRSTGMGRSNLPLWIALGMLSGGSRSHSGSWGSFSGGSGGFGGGGFGGFSGGGGGGFGGGGAGGSW